MKLFVMSAALVLSFASAAQASTNLGFSLTGQPATPDLVTIVQEKTPGYQDVQSYLEAQFYMSECEATGVKNGLVTTHSSDGTYTMVVTKLGEDCGIEYSPKRSWYKVKFDFAFGSARSVVINGKRLAIR